MVETKSIGDMVNYITFDGVKSGKIVAVVELKDAVFYHVDNGDYVDDSPLVAVKTYPTTELVNAFKELKDMESIIDLSML